MRRQVRDLRAQARVQPQAFTPDDTYYGAYQWHLKAPDGTATANGVANLGGSNVNNAWDLADGNGVVIAVLDTGITAHPDIDTSLADAGYDFITDALVSGRDTAGRAPGGWDLGDCTAEVTGGAKRGGSNVNNAWDIADGDVVVIAVLDTGITAHPDIDTSLADAGYDFITDAFVSGRDTDGRAPGGWDLGDWTTEDPWLSEGTNAQNPPDDSSWHGTHVPGTPCAGPPKHTAGS